MPLFFFGALYFKHDNSQTKRMLSRILLGVGVLYSLFVFFIEYDAYRDGVQLREYQNQLDESILSE